MRRGIVLLALIAVIAPGVFAEGPELSVEGVVINGAILPFPVPMGADLQLGLPLASPGGLPLTAVLRLRAGYEDLRFLRDDATGNPIAAPKDLGLNYFMSPNFQWAAGLVQAIIPAEKVNLLEAFLFYRGRYDIYNPDLSTSVFSDAQGLFGSSVLVGLGYDALAKDSRRVRSGIGAEASAEWGPGAVNEGTDFWRLNAQGEFYLPLLSKGRPENERLNLFSIYLAGYLSADYAGGAEPPIWVMQSLGGRDLKDGLGSRIRGFPSMSYDSSLKVVANGEIRVLGPALFGQAWCIPSVYIFCDTAYYAGLAQAATQSDARGVLSSAGLGFNLDVFDSVYIGLYGGLKFPGSDSLYATYGETQQYFWKLGFLLHF